MIRCQGCNTEFPNRLLVEGRWRSLTRRKFCLTCSPYGAHNTKSHLGTELVSKKAGRRWTEDHLHEAVGRSSSVAEVMRNLGLAVSGMAHKTVRNKIQALGLDTSHFDPNAGKSTGGIKLALPEEQVFCENSSVSSGVLRSHVEREGILERRCLECGIGEMYNGKPIVLQLDHINGIRTDNRRGNLRYLCPNCHSQTPTWGMKHRDRPPDRRAGPRHHARRADHDEVRSRYADVGKWSSVGREFGISGNAVKKIVNGKAPSSIG